MSEQQLAIDKAKLQALHAKAGKIIFFLNGISVSEALFTLDVAKNAVLHQSKVEVKLPKSYSFKEDKKLS